VAVLRGSEECARVLCLNSGSSSLKFALYARSGDRDVREFSGAAERIGLSGGRLVVRGPGGEPLEDRGVDFAHHRDAIEVLLHGLGERGIAAPDAVGHRVVHGGPDHDAPERVGPKLLAELRELVRLAPLHLPSAIQAIEAVAAAYPRLPQVACFDTAFHRHVPEIAQLLPLPRALWDQGVRRYGFHGLSYEYVVQELAARSDERVVIAHLGNGASLTAVRGRTPVETTMGLTPTGGVMMGTRSGDLDPGVLLFLMNERGYDAPALAELVNHGAGLLAVSGRSPDMKTLLEKRSTDPRAAQAVEMFCYQVRGRVGQLAAALGGLDTLVFTGGIGERAAPVREQICRGLEHLGVRLDLDRNAAHSDPLSASDAACAVRVIPTNEDLMIARHIRSVLAGR
jgi:acetate kinase